ncbi:hypothetical protein ACP70R_008605 [Stipagrostis hirtigluma subsp. patula]
MASIALGSVEKIFRLALKIKEAVKTVRQNEKECRDIERCVARASALLRRLQETTAAAMDEAMRDTLEDLAESLERALELVAACQRRPKLRRLLGAGDMAKKLGRVQDDIVRKLTLGNFATNLQLTIMLTNVHSAGAAAATALPSRPQDNDTSDVEEDEAVAWELARTLEFTFYDLSQVLEATSNFSEGNKIGLGGFGPVYKGRFRDGTEIAVKRLGSRSGQGFNEFQKEFQVSPKLQHINVVRLLGCCKEGEEKILVYEYLPNKSLDSFIFDETRRATLDWNKRLSIIEGIAQGLLYMQKYSRVHVIHRDIKASNILLDREMNPKISDFGLAKIFIKHEPKGRTNRVVGTYGYMAPEYAMEGIFSVKSDVFSFGVLILEIISGRRVSSFYVSEGSSLPRHAWQLWKDGLWLQFLDASLVTEFHRLVMMRCINIALLCVQENPDDRPAMSDVVAFLSSERILLPEPKPPASFKGASGGEGEDGSGEIVSDLTDGAA